MTRFLERSSLRASEPSRVGRPVGPMGSHLLADVELDFPPPHIFVVADRIDLQVLSFEGQCGELLNGVLGML